MGGEKEGRAAAQAAAISIVVGGGAKLRPYWVCRISTFRARMGDAARQMLRGVLFRCQVGRQLQQGGKNREGTL
jgi:hypothetical protein